LTTLLTNWLATFRSITLTRWGKLISGLTLFGVGVALMKLSDLGLSPWEVLHDGISESTGIKFGTVSVYVGALVLLLWLPLREMPGIGTILNILMIGNVTNVVLDAITPPAGLIWHIGLMVAGLLVTGLGSALYLGSRLGAGPRDGLMMSLHRHTGRSIRLIRTLLEVTVLGAGWLMGGTVGVGTVAFAFGIGPIVQFMFGLIGEHELAGRKGGP
jgi:uncharacterized membrane protein YczE